MQITTHIILVHRYKHTYTHTWLIIIYRYVFALWAFARIDKDTHTQRQRNLNDPERKLEIWIKIWSLAFVIVDVFRQLAQGQRVARSFAALGGFQKNCGCLDFEEVNSIAASKAWFVFKNRLEQNHSGKDLMDVLLLRSPLADLAAARSCKKRVIPGTLQTVPPRHDLLLLGRGSGPVLLHAAPWILKDGMAHHGSSWLIW